MYEKAFHRGTLENLSFLVTGGAGFIGSHIVEYLLHHGAKKVLVIDNLATGNMENILPFVNHRSFEFRKVDISDEQACLDACEGIDYVSHQAALGSVPRSINDPLASNAANVTGFLNVLNAARLKGVKRVVFASSSSVYGDSPLLPKVEDQIGQPLSPYAVTKFTNELYAKVFHRTYGQEVLGLRYFNIFGPRQDPNGPYAAVMPIFVSKSMRGETVFIDGDGEQTRDFTFVENAVQANIRAMFTDHPEAPGKVYNIAVGENYSVNYLFESIQKLTGRTGSAVHRPAREGDIRNSLADISLAKNLLGYRPEVRFEDGLKQTVTYFLEYFGRQA